MEWEAGLPTLGSRLSDRWKRPGGNSWLGTRWRANGLGGGVIGQTRRTMTVRGRAGFLGRFGMEQAFEMASNTKISVVSQFFIWGEN